MPVVLLAPATHDDQVAAVHLERLAGPAALGADEEPAGGPRLSRYQFTSLGRVVALDLPGFGHSDQTRPELIAPDAMGEFLARLIDEATAAGLVK